LRALVQTSDLIIRGRVQTIHAFWRTDQRIIESNVTIAVAYTLLGDSSPQVTIRTVGGYLAAKEIGMVSPHAATFAVGEEVLLFAVQQEAGWRTVGGATGKFLVKGNQIINQDLALAHSLEGLLPTVVELVKRRGLQTQLPTAWRHLTAWPVTQQAQTLTAQSDKRRWATPHASAAFYLNLNTAQMGDADGDHNAFRQAIVAAANRWGAVADADFTLAYAGETNATATGYNGVNEVLFMRKGSQERAAAAQVWYTADQTIVEADIWINEDYAWNATGAPDADEVDLQSALLHEFGHWLILGHSADGDAVMFARLTAGTLKRDLQPPDERGIRAIYPR
jgi:Ca2+-binding RTX toxin-like protein